TVYAEAEKAGYSRGSTGPRGDSYPPEVEISPEQREAELTVHLPPKAGFLEIHLTARGTDASIFAMHVAVMPMENPESPLFSMSCDSNHVILVRQAAGASYRSDTWVTALARIIREDIASAQSSVRSGL